MVYDALLVYEAMFIWSLYEVAVVNILDCISVLAIENKINLAVVHELTYVGYMPKKTVVDNYIL